MSIEIVSVLEAERMTGLPAAVIQALADCGELPAQRSADQLCVGKAALLAWCRLFAKILAAVVTRQRHEQVGSGVTARSLVWMAQSGLLSGKDRVRV